MFFLFFCFYISSRIIFAGLQTSIIYIYMHICIFFFSDLRSVTFSHCPTGIRAHHSTPTAADDVFFFFQLDGVLVPL